MPTEKEVYAKHASQYERLIQREDYQNNLLPAIEQVCNLDGTDVVELGAGTGRLTRLLAPRAHSIRAFDASGHMLAALEASLRSAGLKNWRAEVADHRNVPVADASADLVISGWSFCYLAVWGGDKWRQELERGLAEIRRILRPHGTVIFIETLGTGYTMPTPPEHLSGYYAWLNEKGFRSTWVRTDYEFESSYEARELIRFFFDDNTAQEMRFLHGTHMPECTGLWWWRDADLVEAGKGD